MSTVSIATPNGFQSSNLWVQNITAGDNASFQNLISTNNDFLGGILPGRQIDTYKTLSFTHDGLQYDYTGLFTITTDRGLLSLTGNVSAGGYYDHIAVSAGGSPVASYQGLSIPVDFGSKSTGVVPDTVGGVLSLVNGILFGGGASATQNYQNLTLNATPNLPDIAFSDGVSIYGGAGADVISGAANSDFINAGSGNDVLNGGTGADTLIGGAGADTMIGGAGDDTYGVDNFNDIISEDTGAGFDTVYSSVSYTLAANVDALFLEEGAGPLSGTGNALGNALIGNSSANVLTGGGGDDVYGVNGSIDTVVEAVNSGYDQIYSSANYAMAANVETLFLTGSAVYGTGNSDNNALIGNDADNVLDAGAGTFENLVGGGGSDILIGGAGHDQLLGGSGSDFFRLQNPNIDVFNGSSNDGDFFIDFSSGQGDKVQLNASAFGLGFGVVDGLNFFSGTGPQATQATPTLLYNTQSGTLFYDADGSGAGGLTILAGFGGAPNLHASDIALY